MGEVIGGLIVFGLLFWLAGLVLEAMIKFIGWAVANFVSTILVVGGVIVGLGLLAGEASAAMAIAVPASFTVAKMRIATGGF